LYLRKPTSKGSKKEGETTGKEMEMKENREAMERRARAGGKGKEGRDQWKV